jgi:hypothetical protein
MITKINPNQIRVIIPPPPDSGPPAIKIGQFNVAQLLIFIGKLVNFCTRAFHLLYRGLPDSAYRLLSFQSPIKYTLSANLCQAIICILKQAETREVPVFAGFSIVK